VGASCTAPKDGKTKVYIAKNPKTKSGKHLIQSRNARKQSSARKKSLNASQGLKVGTKYARWARTKLTIGFVRLHARRRCLTWVSLATKGRIKSLRKISSALRASMRTETAAIRRVKKAPQATVSSAGDRVHRVWLIVARLVCSHSKTAQLIKPD
jgi:hypothetical protein